MPKIELSKSSLLKRLDMKLDDEKLAHAISFLGTDLEGIEGDVIHVEIFPNRPDLLSEVGMARALSSFLGKKTGFIHYEVKPAKNELIIEPPVKKVRPCTSCCIVRNLQLDQHALDEIIQAQEKMHITFGRKRDRCAIGIYPLDKINWPVKYTAKKPQEISFTPLDEKQMTGSKILEEHPKGKEFAHLLQDKSVYPIFIDNNKTILSMPPIINSEEAGRVTVGTTEVFVECSGHNQVVLDKALAMLATMLSGFGGTIEAVSIIDGKHRWSSPNLEGTIMQLDDKYANKRLGSNLSVNDMCTSLQNMGFDAVKSTKGLAVQIPAYRDDIMHPVDLVEDIAIAQGFDNMEPKIRLASTIGQEHLTYKIQKKINELLVGLSCVEAATFVITSDKIQEELMHGEGKIEEHIVKLQNPTSEEFNAMSAWLTPQLLQVLKTNTKHAYPQKIFTQNQVVSMQANNNIKEEIRTAVALCGDKITYTDIKQHMHYVLERLGISDVEIKPSAHPSFIPGRCGRIVYKNVSIGFLGEIHPQVLVNFGLQHPVSTLELLDDKIEGMLYESK